jgi:hypothetical protein
VRITPDEITRFARNRDFQLLALEQIRTQYMWITCRKMPAGWTAQLAWPAAVEPARIRNISNALTGEAAAPATGPLAALSLWIERLPADCDLNHLTVRADGLPCRAIHVGEPDHEGVSQLTAALPEGLRTGLVPVDVEWLGRPVCPQGWLRIIPAGPLVPRITAVADGVNLLSGNRIASGVVKLVINEVTSPDEFRVMVDGKTAPETESFCADPTMRRYEFNFHLPPGSAPGPHVVQISFGKRQFAPLPIEVV